MDPNGANPPQEPKDLPSMMRQMMERMCGESEFSPADMCEQMMAAMKKKTRREPPETPAGSTADASTSEGSTPEERKVQDEAPRGCCGPGARCTPNRP